MEQPRLNYMIVEDEPLSSERLRRLLDAHPELQCVAESTDAESALTYVNHKGAPQIAFLDIELPGELSGMDLAERLSKHTLIVFITAHEDYALPAFRVNAVDYLLKPIKATQIASCIERIKERLKIFTRTHPEGPRLALHSRSHFKAEGDYSVFSKDGLEMTINANLLELEDRLGAFDFVRCHRSYLVNMRHVKTLIKNGDQVLAQLRDDILIPISRRTVTAFKRRLGVTYPSTLQDI